MDGDIVWSFRRLKGKARCKTWYTSIKVWLFALDFLKTWRMEKKPKLTQIQREVLVGILLGDPSLQTFSNGKTYRLRVTQSEQHKEYLFHLCEVFKNLTLSPPKQYLWSDSRNPGKQHKRWSFSTTQQPCFRFYGQQFYSGGEKKVPKLVHRWLKSWSIAYWYMDDGAEKWKGKSLKVRFCTDNFENKEVLRLGQVLQEEYTLKTSLQKKGKGWRLYISTSSYSTLGKVVFPYIVPSMLYKFSLPVTQV